MAEGWQFKDRELTDIEVGGIDHRDHPDYCDAYIESACWKDSGEELNEDEIDELNGSDIRGDIVQEEVIDYLAGAADAAYDAAMGK